MDKKTEKALLGSTSIIYTTDERGKRKIATCFFIRDIIQGEERHFLVTNKHVLENKINASLYLDYYDENTRTTQYNNEIKLTLGKDIKYHDKLDLAIVNADFLKDYKNGGRIFSYSTVGAGMIPTNYNIFSHIQQIRMIGYPDGLYNHTYNHPIVRSGITSTPLSEMHNYRNEFVIDIPSIGGSSGSPIFAEVENKLYLVGVERGTYTRKIEVDFHENRRYHRKIRHVTIDTQLGIAIRSDEISKMLVSHFGS